MSTSREPPGFQQRAGQAKSTEYIKVEWHTSMRAKVGVVILSGLLHCLADLLKATVYATQR